MRPWPVVALGGGLAVGGYDRAVDHAPAGALHVSGALGGPWLLTAFVVGALVRDRRLGTRAGAAALVVGTLLYYGVFFLVEHRTGPFYAARMALAWSAACLPGGGAFGWCGARWRERRGALATVALAGALVGEALLLRTVWRQPGAPGALHAEVLLALVLVVALPRRRLPALALLAPAAVLVVAAELVVRQSLRHAGWAGA